MQCSTNQAFYFGAVRNIPVQVEEEFAFWSRVEGRGSRVTSRGSRVTGRGSRVEGNLSSVTIIFERRQIKISCLSEFPVSVLFYIHT